jgi:hypothetical protein
VLLLLLLLLRPRPHPAAAGVLLDDERRTLSSKLCPWATHAPGMHVRSGDSMDAGASGAAH